MANNRFIVVTLLVLAVIVGVFWYQNIEWVETEHDLGFSEKARREPFLAAGQFLQQQGIQFSAVDHFRDFDAAEFASTMPVDDSIMLMDAYGSVSARRAEQLLSWVKAGGHLLVSLDNPSLKDVDRINDPIFELFSVERIRGDDYADFDTLDTLNTLDDITGLNLIDRCDGMYPQATFSFTGDDDQLEADFLTNDTLYGDSNVYGSVGNDDYEEYQLLQYQYGDGMISYMASFGMWKNNAIGCLDHAYILEQLAPAAGNTLHIYYNRDYPGLFTLLWRHFYAAVVVAALTLLLWLWSRMLRFGPVQQSATGSQRQILEHIRASAGFLWRMDKGESLITQVREEVRRLLRQRIQHLDRLSEAEQVQLLSSQLRVTEDAITVALFSPPAKDPVSFTHTIRALQHIKDKL